jgi:hypothetical protein
VILILAGNLGLGFDLYITGSKEMIKIFKHIEHVTSF